MNLQEYKTENLELYRMDNMELMAKYPDNYFDLAIVDPPYGININHNIGRRKGDVSSSYKKVEWDSEIPAQGYFDTLQRVSKEQVIWGGNYFANMLPNSPCWLMWDKKFSQEVSFAQYEMAWTSFKTSAKKYDKHPSQQHRIHPTQKPVALYKWILENYAKPEYKILDTHLGSGSIAIACHYFGCHLTGCELDQDYFNDMVKRVKRDTEQVGMF